MDVISGSGSERSAPRRPILSARLSNFETLPSTESKVIASQVYSHNSLFIMHGFGNFALEIARQVLLVTCTRYVIPQRLVLHHCTN